MRLIDADALQNTLLPITTALEHEYGSLGGAVSGCMKHIDNAPTVDAVPVVRCRECKHFRHYGKTSLFINGKNIKAGWCQRRISYDEEYRMTADDFCSYGERKGGAE